MFSKIKNKAFSRRGIPCLIKSININNYNEDTGKKEKTWDIVSGSYIPLTISLNSFKEKSYEYISGDKLILLNTTEKIDKSSLIITKDKEHKIVFQTELESNEGTLLIKMVIR